MNEILGERIKALRSGTHLTQEQVADKIGISRQKYARIENGTNNITLEILALELEFVKIIISLSFFIAKVLGVQVADITRVLDETPVIAYRNGDTSGSSEKITEMLDLFYANKHLYTKLQHDDIG